MTEAQLQGKMIGIAENNGYYVVKLIQTNKNGIPDLMLIKDGCCRFVEVKKEGQKARPLQEYRLSELRIAGCLSECIDNILDFEKFIL